MRLIPNFKKCSGSQEFRLNVVGDDNSFLLRHPRLLLDGFRLLMCAVLILPMVLWMGVVLWYPAPNSFWIIVGEIGAFLIGCAAISWISAFCNQYPGHRVVAIFLLSGIAITALSAVKLYT